jgi:CO/xanthine dehydrogenase FAD-binding subunit
MARAACAVAVVLDVERRTAAIAVAAAGPVPLRASAAEALVAGAAWEDELGAGFLEEVGALVAGATAPRSDRRGSAAYKRHAAAVLSRRALARAWRGRAQWR